MIKTNYQVKDRVLITVNSNGKSSQITLPWPIVQVIEFSDVLITRVEPQAGVVFNENVYGVDFSGNVLWQVKKRKYVYEDSPYTGMAAVGDQVKLLNWDGLELLVEPTTGKEISSKYGR